MSSAKSNTFVLFCNPNACFYEYLNYQSEWLQYYTQRLGFNVIIFNYRGYGRSDMSNSSKFLQRRFGVMNPSDVMKDAEVVLEYALEKYAHLPDVFPPSDQNRNKQLKVLVHGESLGGMAATYVAMKSNLGRLPVEFAFIDRTFASLDNVAFWTSGISTLKNKVGREDGSARSSLTCCCIRRTKFSRILGNCISRIFRLVTQWKDNNW